MRPYAVPRSARTACLAKQIEAVQQSAAREKTSFPSPENHPQNAPSKWRRSSERRPPPLLGSRSADVIGAMLEMSEECAAPARMEEDGEAAFLGVVEAVVEGFRSIGEFLEAGGAAGHGVGTLAEARDGIGHGAV